MKAIQIFFTLLGVAAILLGLWIIDDTIWAIIPISAGIWWIYEANKKD